MGQYIFPYFECQSFQERRISRKYFIQVKSEDWLCWNIWKFLVETTMDKYIVITQETCMTESFYRHKSVPLGCICIVYV